ncbi:hypothetical protein N8J89_19435 [Crossiella sp. CA-258035]|uniref:hypothetical protein n=1 Tax=Crossiella sp. CA-258035 TaxID=2981138 RepID=UPI0024BCC0A2|nr:hypothetical protein [Crossiella sp. CA-258035]WHT23163.1 hypothetical protein N8J89_19435 [Crossiella sp. CA-258035]
MSSPTNARDHVGVLNQAVDEALTAIGTGTPDDPAARAQRARQPLTAALAQLAGAREELSPRALAYTEAACRHLEYGELMEARMLLTAVRAQAGAATQPAPVVSPS